MFIIVRKEEREALIDNVGRLKEVISKISRFTRNVHVYVVRIVLINCNPGMN